MCESRAGAGLVFCELREPLDWSKPGRVVGMKMESSRRDMWVVCVV